jgi:two-component system nitrate/nitrite response regulator NarL
MSQHRAERASRPSYATARLLLQTLTPRERDVLYALMRGETAATIAQRSGVSYATARTHVQRVLMKLGVHSRTEAISFAVRAGVTEQR